MCGPVSFYMVHVGAVLILLLALVFWLFSSYVNVPVCSQANFVCLLFGAEQVMDSRFIGAFSLKTLLLLETR